MTTEPRVAIFGLADTLQACAAVAERAENVVHKVQLPDAPDGRFDLHMLGEFAASGWSAFAAVGPDLLNMKRLGLVSQLRGAGYRLAAIVSARADVPKGWKATENTFIDDRVVVGDGVSMRYNVFIGAGAILGTGVKLGHSVWIGPGAILGAGVEVGDGTIVAAGAVLAPGIRVGRYCELAMVREYRQSIEGRTYFSGDFDGPVRIHQRAGSASGQA